MKSSSVTTMFGGGIWPKGTGGGMISGAGEGERGDKGS